MRGDRRKQEQMSSPRQLGAWQRWSTALPRGRAVGSKGVQDGCEGGRDGDRLHGFPTPCLCQTHLLEKVLVFLVGRRRARVDGDLHVRCLEG